VRETAQAGPSVPQGSSRLEQIIGHRVPDWNEDGCLTLNIFCPSRAHEGQAPRPVLVWFHGGGFTSGSGGWDWYDGTRLAVLGDKVVVTANYRVGPLRHLYLPEIGAGTASPTGDPIALTDPPPEPLTNVTAAWGLVLEPAPQHSATAERNDEPPGRRCR